MLLYPKHNNIPNIFTALTANRFQRGVVGFCLYALNKRTHIRKVLGVKELTCYVTRKGVTYR